MPDCVAEQSYYAAPLNHVHAISKLFHSGRECEDEDGKLETMALCDMVG